MTRILFFLLFVTPYVIFSQSAEVNVDKNIEGGFVFNTGFIHKNKIKTIAVSVANKPDNQVIEDKGLVKGYEFDSMGLLMRYYTSVIKASEKQEIDVPAVYRKGKLISKPYTKSIYRYGYDTISTRYHYDNNNRLTIKRTKYGDVYHSWYFQYDNQGQLIKQINARETNLNINDSEFKLGVQTVISKEEFEYEILSKNQVKIKCLNDEGRLYKVVIINKDDNGRVVSESHEFIVGGIRQEYSYEYNTSGKVVKKKYSSNDSGTQMEELVYEYDAAGQLLSEVKFRNGIKTNELSYLYDASDKSLKSLLDRDFNNKSIGIIKFTYNYYEAGLAFPE